MKLSQITEKMQKIEEAAKIREEQNVNFSKQAEQKLLSKMESNKENRNQLMNQLMEKLKKTVSELNILFIYIKYQKIFILFFKDNKIAQIRELTTKETQRLEDRIKNKLETAEENRLEKINALTERLKEHVNYFF
jgi:hypothetical protein